jgi:hypothetical protein
LEIKLKGENMALPKEIYVTQHQDEDGGWYCASLSPEAAVSGSKTETPEVGTYRLVESSVLELVRTVKVRKAKKGKAK